MSVWMWLPEPVSVFFRPGMQPALLSSHQLVRLMTSRRVHNSASRAGLVLCEPGFLLSIFPRVPKAQCWQFVGLPVLDSFSPKVGHG